MKERRFLHHRNQFFNADFSGVFLEKRRVFESGTSGSPSQNVSSSIPSINTNPQSPAIQNALQLQRLKQNINGNNISTYPTAMDSRGSFENMGQKLTHDIQKHGPKNANNFLKNEHFKYLLTEDIPKNTAKNLQSVQKELEAPKGVLKPNHTTQTIENQNIKLWLKNKDKQLDANSSFKFGQEWEQKKIKIFTNQANSQVQYIQAEKGNLPTTSSADYSSVSTNPTFTVLLSGTPLSAAATVYTQSNIEKLLVDISLVLQKKPVTLKGNEQQILERVQEFLIHAWKVTETRDNLTPSTAIPWKQKIITLKKDITTKQQEIKILEDKKSINSLTRTEETSLIKKEQELYFLEEKLDLREEYHTEYKAQQTGENGYEMFFESKTDKLKKPTNAIKNLGEYYSWIEKEIFTEGIPPPTNPAVRAALVANVYRGRINAEVLHTGMLKMVSSAQTRTNNQINNTQYLLSITDFYNQLGILLNTQDKTVQTPVFNTLKKYFSEKDATIIFNSLSRNKKLGDFSPEISRKHGISVEKGFQKKHGISPNQIWQHWKKNLAKPIASGEVDKTGGQKTIGEVFPVENWFDENQQFAIKDLGNFKSALAAAIPVNLVQKSKSSILQKFLNQSWDPRDPEAIDFLQSVQGYFLGQETIEDKAHFSNTEKGAEKFMKEVKQSFDGGKVSDFISNAFDEAMDGNPSYVALLGIAGFFFFKNKKVRNIMLGLGGAAAMNEVVRDTTGVDYLQQGLDLIAGNSDAQKGNVASWVSIAMNRNKELEHDNITFDEFERAGTILGGNNFPDILAWRQECMLRKAKGETKIYANDKMPKGLQKNLSRIRYGNNANKEDNAEIAFTFLDRYFLHIDKKNGNNPPSLENGKKYLSDTYDKDEKGDPYTMSAIYFMESGQEEQQYVLLDKSPIIEIFGEWTDETYVWLGSQARSLGVDMPTLLNKFRTVKNWAKAKGLEMKIAVNNELQFFDGTKHVWSVVEDGGNWVVKESTGIVGLGPNDQGYPTMTAAIDALVAYSTQKITNLNGMVMGVDTSSFTDSLKMTDATDAKNTLQAWGSMPEIAKMYGFVRPIDFEQFLTENWTNISREMQKFSGKTATNLTKKDLFQFFVGPAFIASLPATGITKGAQWIHEAMSATVQTVLPFDKLENIYEALTIRTDTDVQKYIGGRDAVRGLVDTSRESDFTKNVESWTITDIENLKTQYKSRMRGLLITNWGYEYETDIDGLLNHFLYTIVRKEYYSNILNNASKDKTITTISKNDMLKKFHKEFMSFAIRTKYLPDRTFGDGIDDEKKKELSDAISNIKNGKSSKYDIF